MAERGPQSTDIIFPDLMWPPHRGNVQMTWPTMLNNRTRKMNDLVAVQKIAGWQKLKMLVLDSAP